MITDPGQEVELASKIASRFLGEQPANVTPLMGRGSVNKIFVVETGISKIVVRMSDDVEALDQYKKEAWCIKKAAARGVPVPTVLAVGESEGNAFMLQTYVTGDEGRDSPVAETYVWRELGKHAKLIHSTGVAGFGLKSDDFTQGDSRDSWLRHVQYNIESLTEADALIELNVLTKSQSKTIRKIFEDLKDREFNFGLNHGDLSLKNTIIDKSGKVSLLDWGSAAADVVPHFDLIQMLKMKMLENNPNDAGIRAFLEGYGISQGEFEMMQTELDALLLLRAFDKLRWALDWNIQELGRFVTHAKQAVERKLHLRTTI